MQASQELGSLCLKPEEANLRGCLMPSLILFILHYFTIIIYLSVCVCVPIRSEDNGQELVLSFNLGD